MTTFVGMEYIIANAFIYLSKNHILTLGDINKYRMKVQEYWSKNDIDAIIVGDIEAVAYNYETYFIFHKEAHIIVLQSGISIEHLRQRFVGYLPFDIITSFVKVGQFFL